MDESGPTEEPVAACAEDQRRVRELYASLQRERAERQRVEQASEELNKLVHSLNNVLSIISTYSAALSDEIEADHPSRDSVEEISRASKRAVGIARKVVDHQRRTARAKPPDHGRR